MSRLKANVAANFAGQAWTGILQLLLVPFYLHYLGVEAYGLIGLYLMLLASVQLFDIGFSQTLNRELARRSSGACEAADGADLLRTMETVYWAIVLAVCLMLFYAAPAVARSVLKPSALDPDALHTALLLMVSVIALNWPAGLYYNGLLGLQRQVLANMLRMVVGTVTGVGSLLVLAFVSPSIEAFFCWQLASGMLGLVATMIALRRALPPADHRARFRPGLLRAGWRFTAGAGSLSISGLILTQFDKWILIKVLPLEGFGYYTLANTVANVLHYAIAPLFAAMFPRLTALLAAGHEASALRIYHIATQAVTTVIVPTAVFLALFSYEVIALWTGNREVTIAVAPLATIMVVGTGFNCLMHMPYALQLARGRTGLFLLINVVAILILVPSVAWAAPRVGAIAGAVAWLALNASYLLVAAPIAHRGISARERILWLLQDIARPAAAALAVLVAGRLLIDAMLAPFAMLSCLAAVLGLAILAAGLNAPELRASVRLGSTVAPPTGRE